MAWSYPDPFVARVGVELEPVLEPGDLRPRDPSGHAHKADLPAQLVALHEVGRLHDAGALKRGIEWTYVIVSAVSS